MKLPKNVSIALYGLIKLQHDYFNTLEMLKSNHESACELSDQKIDATTDCCWIGNTIFLLSTEISKNFLLILRAIPDFYDTQIPVPSATYLIKAPFDSSIDLEPWFKRLYEVTGLSSSFFDDDLAELNPLLRIYDN